MTTRLQVSSFSSWVQLKVQIAYKVISSNATEMLLPLSRLFHYRLFFSSTLTTQSYQENLSRCFKRHKYCTRCISSWMCSTGSRCLSVCCMLRLHSSFLYAILPTNIGYYDKRPKPLAVNPGSEHSQTGRKTFS